MSRIGIMIGAAIVLIAVIAIAANWTTGDGKA
jgi:nitrogen fixation-related uncharacterized protein